MILAGIKIDGIPEGWEPVRYGVPKDGEHYMGTSDQLAVAQMSQAVTCLGHRLIVRKKPGFSVDVTWEGKPKAKPRADADYRPLLIGEPVMPGDIIETTDGNNTLLAAQHYKDLRPKVQKSGSCVKYMRYPWTFDEYLARQKDWIEFHNLKKGDPVKVCCVAEHLQDGWENDWLPYHMGQNVGHTLFVSKLPEPDLPYGITLSQPAQESDLPSDLPSGRMALQYPFYVLQVVKPEPKKPEFRSFRTLLEVLDWVKEHGQLIIREDGEWRTVLRAETSGSGVYITPPVPEPEKWKSAKTGAVFGIIE
jgi:hypothetical protein